MIVVNVNAGLANQMFHYAFGRGLEAKDGISILIKLTLSLAKNGVSRMFNFKMHSLILG